MAEKKEMDHDTQIRLALKILRRMPPQDLENDLVRMSCLIDQDLEDELYQRVDLPLKVQKDSSGKEFVLCEYNRDGDSFRSPWTNEYVPPHEDEDGLKPAADLRKLEIAFNAIFDVYRRQYFQTGVSTVILWTNQDANNKQKSMNEEFHAAFLVQKDVSDMGKKSEDSDEMWDVKGSWSSTHLVACTKTKERNQFQYKITSVVTIDLAFAGDDQLGATHVCGCVEATNQQKPAVKSVDDNDINASHVSNIGPLVEEYETKLTNKVKNQYFARMNRVHTELRAVNPQAKQVQSKQAQLMMAAAKKKSSS